MPCGDWYGRMIRFKGQSVRESHALYNECGAVISRNVWADMHSKYGKLITVDLYVKGGFHWEFPNAFADPASAMCSLLDTPGTIY